MEFVVTEWVGTYTPHVTIELGMARGENSEWDLGYKSGAIGRLSRPSVADVANNHLQTHDGWPYDASEPPVVPQLPAREPNLRRTDRNKCR